MLPITEMVNALSKVTNDLSVSAGFELGPLCFPKPYSDQHLTFITPSLPQDF